MHASVGRAAVRSTSIAWAGLVAIDVASRAAYLAPRLTTLRGALNYVAASLALWITIRFLAALRRPRILYALVVALPMAAEYAMFRSFGQFIESTDLVALALAPRVVLRAAGGGADWAGAAAVFACAWSTCLLLPHAPLRGWRARGLAAVLVVTIGLGATWWRASPSLEHSQPAFCASLAGVLRRTTARRETRRPVLPVLPGKGPNVVLVLGESLAASHLSLYGYERDTTPRLRALEARRELVALKNAVVMGPHTRTSVPYIMTGLAGPDPDGRVFGAPNVLEYAKSRGYHTAFVSAQDESWGDLDGILRPGADTFRTGLQFAAEVDVLKGGDDLVVLEQGVLPAIRTLEEPFLLVVHMDGSHVPYASHAPASHKVWPEDGANSVGAYDNTIRVTDEYLDRVFHALRERDPGAYLFFTSDHGQALGEGGAFYHRGYQSNVVRDPLLVFAPDPAPWAALAEAPVSACDLAPTVLHLLGATPATPMDCADLLAPLPVRSRVVSAYTPAFLAEPTMLVLAADGSRALYDLGRGTVVTDDGTTRPLAEVPVPPDVRARLGR